ncbi:MAG TPA: HdeA/HdeB family chaperone [Xanthobacteraceae bacterium]|nr:HdeA/HdeB family chaperone [Xanthobacteraceae bacterium]
MRRDLTLALTAVIVLEFAGLTTGAHAQHSSIPCDSFQKNADGSWTVLSTTFIEGPQVKVQEGVVLPPGYKILGYDIGGLIAKACPDATVDAPAQPVPATAAPTTAAPGTVPARTQQPSTAQAPQISLSSFADANGNIDLDRLTCGQLDDASNSDVDVLLAWYSGRYSGPSKKRAANTINIARLRYAMRNVADYCRANRDKKLTPVMELMLK